MSVQLENKLRILAIGNSFSDDATYYLNEIAAAEGIGLFVVNLCIGGCSLERHWNNICGDAKEYFYRVNGISTGIKVSIKEALESREWDYITLQQNSLDSVNLDSYYPYIEDMAKYIHEIKPEAKLMIHQTWSYKTDNEHLIELYNNEHEKMFADIKANYDYVSKKIGEIINEDGSPLKIIPSGTALEYVRENDVFNDKNEEFISLFRDMKHLTFTHGRYTAGAVWYEVFSGNSILTNTYKVEGITDEEMDILKLCVHKAGFEYGWIK